MEWVKRTDNDRHILFSCEYTGVKYILFFNKENNTCTYTCSKFFTYDDMWIPQQAETNEFVKWSAKYGYWQVVDTPIDPETAEFICLVFMWIEAGCPR